MIHNHEEYALHTMTIIVIMKAPKIEPNTIVNTFFLLILATLGRALINILFILSENTDTYLQAMNIVIRF